MPRGKNYGKVGPDRTIDDVMKRRQDRWNFPFIAGMWFQDLFNYDFRRTEQCIIPYATQEGEISFCAYNTGVELAEHRLKMHMTSTLTKWYEEHGRHEIFAGGKKVNMEDKEHLPYYLREEIVTHEVQHDLDKLGIAKTAREEKKRARDSKAESNKVKNDAAYDARMAQLYREVVLKEKPELLLRRRVHSSGRACTAAIAPANGGAKRSEEGWRTGRGRLGESRFRGFRVGRFSKLGRSNGAASFYWLVPGRPRLRGRPSASLRWRRRPPLANSAAGTASPTCFGHRRIGELCISVLR